MNESQREQVVSNAKYLQQVRPIDPEEICEYVEGGPHPSAVREVLREEALTLGFRERPDGTFVPASNDPLDVGVPDVLESFPEEYATVLESLLVEEFGPGWPDGDSGDELRGLVRDIKGRYLRGDPVAYDYRTALAYAIYHLPATYAAARWIVGSLAADGEIPGRLRVLDVGAGVGGPAVALADLLDGRALVEYEAVEPSDAAEVLADVLETTGPNLHPTIHRDRAESFDPDPDANYDVVICSNVLSELERPAEVASDYLQALAEHGTLVAIAPADRETAIGLRDVERSLEGDVRATVYAPTVRLWPGRRPESRSWSFDRDPDLAVPGFQRRLDAGERATPTNDEQPGSGEFVNVDVQYAYSLLRTDGRRRIEYDADHDTLAPLADSEGNVTDRIDCVAIKLSHDLADEPDANPLYLVGDGSQQTDHFAVLTRTSQLNEPLEIADYGALLRFENVLVLWNDDEEAFNLVVDGETVVDDLPV